MARMLWFAAIAAVGHLSSAAAIGLPPATVPLATAIEALDAHVEAQTVARMRDLVERDVASLTHGFLRREARRVVASTAPGSIVPQPAPVES